MSDYVELRIPQQFFDEIVKDACSHVAYQDDDEFCVDDYAGGNIDDAFWRGTMDGERALSRQILIKSGRADLIVLEED